MYYHDGVCTWFFFQERICLKTGVAFVTRQGFCRLKEVFLLSRQGVIFIVGVGIYIGGDYSGCGGVSVSGWWLCC